MHILTQTFPYRGTVLVFCIMAVYYLNSIFKTPLTFVFFQYLTARRSSHDTNKFGWKAYAFVCLREMFITSTHCRYILYIELMTLSKITTD